MQMLKECPTVPLVGLGLWKASGDVIENTVYEAIKAGYRHLDGACDYGNEKEVGAGIKKAIAEGICKREELFVVSKLWNTFHKQEHVPIACQKSLDDLGLDYLDGYYIHFPISLEFVPLEAYYPPEWTDKPGNAGKMKVCNPPVSYKETWQAMEKLVEAGKVKNIGVSNVGVQTLQEVLSYCKVKPFANQVELHLYNQMPKLIAFCQANGIAVTAFSPLGALSYISIGMANADEDALKDPVVTEIAAAKGKSAAQVALRFLVQQGVCVIPKTTSPARLVENKDVFGFELTAEEMGKLVKLDRRRRFNDPGEFTKQWDMPFGWPIHA